MAITVVEDSDPIIVYQGTWSQMLDKFASNGSTMTTSQYEATATITFAATNISVFGTVPVLGAGQTPAIVTFTLDNAAALPVSTWTAQPSRNITQYYIPMYRSPMLTEDRLHTLVVTHKSAPGGTLYLDYMTVQGPLLRYATPGEASSESSGGMGSTAKTAVVGGVLGGVILILLGLVVTFWLKNRRTDAKRSIYSSDGKGNSTFMPYNQSPMNTGSVAGNTSEAQQRSLAMSPAMSMYTGFAGSNQQPFRPPLPEMHES